MKKIQLGGHRRGGKVSGYALIDDEDFEKVNKYRWHLGYCEYASTSASVGEKQTTSQMHRLIMGAIKGQMIDHKDGNKLNNQKSNLRYCTGSENQANRTSQKNNTSGFTGVFKSGKRWIAQIGIKNRQRYLGIFTDKESAAKAYNQAAKKNYGEFARLNIIKNQNDTKEFKGKIR